MQFFVIYIIVIFKCLNRNTVLQQRKDKSQLYFHYFQLLPNEIASNFPFSFDDNGNSRIGYTIKNFRPYNSNEVPTSGNQYGRFLVSY